MAGPFEALLGVASVASSALSIFSAVKGTERADENAELSRQQYAEEVVAAQEDARLQEQKRREELQRILGAQDAIRGARGLNVGSAQGDVLAAESVRQSDLDVEIIRNNAKRVQTRLATASDQAGINADAQKWGLYGTAVSGLLSGARGLRDLDRAIKGIG